MECEKKALGTLDLVLKFGQFDDEAVHHKIK
jgi:hypothetical protein